MKIMKDPMDLDIFDGDQAMITRKVDETGRKGIDTLLGNCLGAAMMARQIMLGTIPLPLWQRAAFEAHASAESSGTLYDKKKAEVFWMHARFLQETEKQVMDSLADPDIRKAMESEGWDLSEFPIPDNDD